MIRIYLLALAGHFYIDWSSLIRAKTIFGTSDILNQKYKMKSIRKLLIFVYDKFKTYFHTKGQKRRGKILREAGKELQFFDIEDWD